MGLKGSTARTDAGRMRRRSTVVVERPEPHQNRPYQLTVASESQTWRVRRNVTMSGERAPAGRSHAVLGASTRTLCGLDHAELARFPFVDFVTSSVERCEVCRTRGAALLH
jgi:hypothetical protein